MQRPVLQLRPSELSRRPWRPSRPHVRVPGQSERLRGRSESAMPNSPPRPPSVFVHSPFPRRERNHPAVPGRVLTL